MPAPLGAGILRSLSQLPSTEAEAERAYLHAMKLLVSRDDFPPQLAEKLRRRALLFRSMAEFFRQQ